MLSKFAVTVIIPTMASAKRAQALRRAVDSIRKSSTKPIKIIAVVNGTQADSALCHWLTSQADVQYERISTPSSPLAVLHGCQLVQTPYFSFLDDDDEYLTGGTDIKLDAFRHCSDADIVITRGLRHCDDIDEPIMTTISTVPEAPLKRLFESNWLGSCNALFRSAAFHPDFFYEPHPYAEWTWLAYKLAIAGKKIVAVDEPTFRINDTPESLSKTDAYHNAYQALYQRMLALTPPPDIARAIRTRSGADWHHQSFRALQRGDRMLALRFHFSSLMLPGGLKYLSYTRHLIPPWPMSWYSYKK